MKKLSFLAFAVLFITILSKVGQDPTQFRQRETASFKQKDFSCQSQFENFMQNNYSTKLHLALQDKKLVQKSYDSIIIRKPSRSWLQNMRDSFHRILKTLNRKKHSVYYLDNDETLTSLNVYSDLYAKSLKGEIEEEGTEILSKVDAWVEKYRNYTVDLKNLTDERVSLEYNIQLLKTINKDVNKAFNEGREYKADIILFVNGKEVPRRYIFRKEDANYTFELSKLIQRRKELDGGMFSATLNLGEITNRIVDQARLHDIVRMHHRELEYYTNNTEDIAPNVKEQLLKKLKDLESLERGYEENKKLLPSEFGVNKIQNAKIKTELMNLPKATKSRNFYKKSEKLVEKYMDDKSKKRLQYRLKGYAKVFQATGLGAGAFALFETGSLIKGLVVWYTYDKNRIDECNEEAADDDETFRACLIGFIKERHPLLYQRSMVDPNFNMFDLENLPSDISSRKVSNYSAFIEKALSKRAYYMIMIERDKAISTKMEKSIKLKHEQMSKDLDLTGLHPCTTVGLDYLAGCMYKYLSRIFAPIFGQEKNSLRLKHDFRQYDVIPIKYRAQYIEEVEKVLNERTRYQDYKDELLNSNEYKSLDK